MGRKLKLKGQNRAYLGRDVGNESGLPFLTANTRVGMLSQRFNQVQYRTSHAARTLRSMSSVLKERRKSASHSAYSERPRCTVVSHSSGGSGRGKQAESRMASEEASRDSMQRGTSREGQARNGHVQVPAES